MNNLGIHKEFIFKRKMNLTQRNGTSAQMCIINVSYKLCVIFLVIKQNIELYKQIINMCIRKEERKKKRKRKLKTNQVGICRFVKKYISNTNCSTIKMNNAKL